MGKIKVKFHPLFFLFAGLLIFFGYSFLLFNYLIVIFLHEYSHAYAANNLGYEIKNIKIYPFGICLNMNSKSLLPTDEIKIALAGPIANLLLCLMCLSIWWLFPSTYIWTYYFCFANFITFVINLLPVFPLDGGRVFLSFLIVVGDKKKSIKWCKVLNIVVSLILLFLFFLSFFYYLNLTFLFMSIFVFCGVFNENKNDTYSFISIDNKLKLKNKFGKIKQVAIVEELELFRLTKFINNHTITEFVVLNKAKKVKFRFLDFELKKIYEKTSPTNKVKDIENMIKADF